MIQCGTLRDTEPSFPDRDNQLNLGRIVAGFGWIGDFRLIVGIRIFDRVRPFGK